MSRNPRHRISSLVAAVSSPTARSFLMAFCRQVVSAGRGWGMLLSRSRSASLMESKECDV
eukprot:677551-Rhodomonas_salina.1